MFGKSFLGLKNVGEKYYEEKIKENLGFFCLFVFSIWIFFHEYSRITGLINSSLPLSPASQTLRHESGDYCRKLTSAHTAQEMKFSIKDFFTKCEEINNGKLHFFCSDIARRRTQTFDFRAQFTNH